MRTPRPARPSYLILAAALVLGVLSQSQEVARAAGPKIQAALPGASHVSSDLLRLLQPGALTQRPARISGVTPELMQWSGPGMVGVTVTATDPAALAPALRQLAVQVSEVAAGHHLLEGFVPLQVLPKLDALAPQGLLGVDPMLLPYRRIGAVTSEADSVLEADRVRGTVPPGLNGTGVKVGVLSDSYNRLGGAPADVSSGDLPSNVQVLEDSNTGADEGRAMLQLVHDLAPGSPLAFATANGGEAHFAANIRRLADPADGNCDVIVDDVIYFDEPMFQDGIVAQAADEVATQRGVPYFSAAGNEANGGYISTNFHASPDAAVAGNFLDWNPGAGVQTREQLTFPAGFNSVVELQWDDPFYTANGVNTDLGFVFLTPGTNTIVATVDNNNITSQRPVERFSVDNRGRGTSTFDVMIRLTTGPAPARLAFVAAPRPLGFQNFATNSGTIYGHAAAKHAMAVGADPYFDQQTPESFTSLGPCTILFAANGTRLGSAEVRKKPDFSAIDGTNTTFFGSDEEGDGKPNFFGTSAAAPHAAAVAALVKQANPGFATQAVYDRLSDTASDIGAPGEDVVTGAGLINAYDAIFSPVTAATLPFTDGFEGGGLSIHYDTRTIGSGRIRPTDSGAPATGAQHAVLDNSRTGFNGLNEMTLHFAVPPGSGAVTLAFKEKESNDADDPMPASFSNSVAADGVALSVNGTSWFRVTSLTGATSTNSYQTFSFNLTQIAQASGVNLGANVRVRFQQFGTQGGIAFDDLSVTAAPGIAPDLLWGGAKVKVSRKGKGANVVATLSGSVTAKNGGKKKSTPCKVHYFLSADNVLDIAHDQSLKEVGLAALKPRQAKALTVKLKLPKGQNPKGGFFFAVVDSRNQVAELNEANNVTNKGPLP